MTTAILSLRLARGMSLRQLAAEVGCSHQTLHRIERGRSKHAWPATRVALEAYFGLPFEVLVAPLPRAHA